jgi:cation/acetate symporter
VDPSLLSVSDVNGDGIVQLAEIRLGPDIVVLAMPEIAGLPYVVTGLVAAGGLAAALSTADGLLLTISNALSHDLYYRIINRAASAQRRVTISKFLLLLVALVAAYVTSLRPGGILDLVAVAFSLAASAFFPALVLGVFWKRANRAGAIAGMLAGFATCLYYVATRFPFFQSALGLNAADWPLWLGIQPISSGLFGVAIGLTALIGVSLVTEPPDAETVRLVESLRCPDAGRD